MEQVQALLELPIDTLVVLAAGYIGYRIAFVGADGRHRGIDIAFRSLAFGLVARIAWNLSTSAGVPDSIAAIGGVISAILAAAFWRRWGASAVFELLRAGRISASDDTATAWDHVRLSVRWRPSQLVVRKVDGSSVMCEILDDYKGSPFGPCVYGEDGSVALYVTAFRQPGGDWEDIDPSNDQYGPALTIIQAREVAELEVRHL